MGEHDTIPRWHVRTATAEDQRQRIQLIATAFSVDGGVAARGNPELASVVGESEDGASWQTVVVGEDQHLVAAATVSLRGQWINGQRLICAAISSVAVERGLRGHGIGTLVMTGALREARDRGAALSALIPSVHGFYRRVGYGVAGRRLIFRLSTRDLLHELPRPSGDHRIRRARPDDAEAVAVLVDRRAERTHGSLDRRALPGGPPDPMEGDESWVLERDGRVRGWCQLGRESSPDREPVYMADVRELVGASVSDEVVLWREVVADVPAAAEAEALVVPGGRLEHLLERRLVPVEAGTWMERVLDVEASLRQRGYPRGLTGQVALRITDDVFPDNTGHWLLQVTEGDATVTRTSASHDALAMSIGDFSAMYMGHLDPVQALDNGWMRGSVEDAERLRSLFLCPPAILFSSF